MDDLTDRVRELLNDPATAERLNGLLGQIGSAPSASPVPPETAGGDLLGQIAPLLAGAGRDSTHVALLKALRPYLHDGREKRLDDAVEMLRLLQILPLLQQRGDRR